MKLHEMIEMYLKYDNMHTNRIFNALNCINNHVNSYTNCMLSLVQDNHGKDKIVMLQINNTEKKSNDPK